MNDIQDYKEENLYTAEEKKKMFGDGIWKEEPDTAKFNFKGIKCLVNRVICKEMSGDYFGGHLCGYCEVPEGKYIKTCLFDEDSISFDVHGGITFDEMEDARQLIGFDCGHGCDLVPSMQSMHKRIKEEAKRMFSEINVTSDIFNATYKDFNYVKMECISLAWQILEKLKEEK